MATARQHARDTLYRPLDAKQLSSQRLARAASDVEIAIQALGAALRERARLGASELTARLRRQLETLETEIEALIARIPALGPFVAMELFRATHRRMSQDDMPTRPSNTVEPSDMNPTLAYLECIGCHMA